jgi:zinc D-Ala-D-Ala carboxypeptidase
MAIKLSPHFTLDEMIITSHTEINNVPTPEDLKRLVYFCKNFMEPVRNHFGPTIIHSGYRSKALNEAIPGSAKNSAHCFGCAADFHVVGINILDTVRWIKDKSNLNYDQVISEHKGSGWWVHLGMVRPGFNNGIPRKQALNMIFQNGEYIYTPFK